MKELSLFDKSLLNLLQGNIPVCSRPFAEMGKILGTDEKTVISRLNELKAAGYLRRIGTFFDSGKMGYCGSLVALEVSPQEIENVAKVINAFPGATHNYERDGKYNLWFTLLTPDTETESKILAKIKSLPGVKDMLRLKANKKYKVNVQFKLR